MTHRLFHWLFASRADGRIVIAQWPSLALWIFLAALAIGEVVPPGAAGTLVRMVGTVSLVVWAIDEILRGVNPWRRLLGAAVLSWLCAKGLLALVHRG